MCPLPAENLGNLRRGSKFLSEEAEPPHALVNTRESVLACRATVGKRESRSQ